MQRQEMTIDNKEYGDTNGHSFKRKKTFLKNPTI